MKQGQCKLVLLGEASVGKTFNKFFIKFFHLKKNLKKKFLKRSLITRFVKEEFYPNSPSTVAGLS